MLFSNIIYSVLCLKHQSIYRFGKFISCFEKKILLKSCVSHLNSQVKYSSNIHDSNVSIPDFTKRSGESKDILLARLNYQSRKRGTLEIGLLLSCFASRYLKTFNDKQLNDYDILINKPTNDWDIYYWIIQSQPTPDEYNTEVMRLLQEYSKNKDKEIRITQPNLN